MASFGVTNGAKSQYLVAICNEDAHKEAGICQQELLERIGNVQVRAFKKTAKFISWMEKRQVKRPCYVVSTWREARPFIEAYDNHDLGKIVHMVIVCESLKQVQASQRWISSQVQLRFPIQVGETKRALQLMCQKLQEDMRAEQVANPSKVSPKMQIHHQPLPSLSLEDDPFGTMRMLYGDEDSDTIYGENSSATKPKSATTYGSNTSTMYGSVNSASSMYESNSASMYGSSAAFFRSDAPDLNCR